MATASLTGAQATPDAQYLVFTTTADLTPDDTSSAAQAFRYDAQSGELIRVSIGQNDFNAKGPTRRLRRRQSRPRSWKPALRAK